MREFFGGGVQGTYGFVGRGGVVGLEGCPTPRLEQTTITITITIRSRDRLERDRPATVERNPSKPVHLRPLDTRQKTPRVITG
ncbi:MULTISPECIES: hypothetical protein [Actinoalloteichus]|uniref:hypothetical protein n=1 Tax=Actinoalloteichus TaxID=65496 RepID=UPI001E622921|nr:MULTISPECIES: hypothetical protein [Actinoalloteichus]